MPRELTLPEQAHVSGRARGENLDSDVEFVLQSTVDEEGTIAFNVPAGTIDLRIAASNLAPIYRWNVRQENGHADLGRLQMVPGASLFGYVVDADTGYPVPAATITAIPAGTENLPISDQEARAAMPDTSARTNERGNFQLLSVTPGAYRLKADHPDYLTVYPAEITVVRNAETILRGNIGLSPPLRLHLEIAPPRSPGGHRWNALLTDPSTGSDVGTAESDREGILRFDHLSPATLRVRVDAEDVHRAFETNIELVADLELPVDIPIVEVVGLVSMNGEPVRGELEIGTGSGDGWNTAIDEEGSFQTWIREPHLEVLFLTVEGEGFSNPAKVTVEGFVVEDGRVELEVELLDLEISGRVVNRRGEPFQGALVIAREGRSMPAKVYSEADGSFTMRPLQTGEHRIRASRRGYGASQEEVLILSESLPSARTELVIRPSRRLEGRLIGPSGEAVAGARIVAFSVDSDLVSATADTDINGAFSAEVAAESRQVVLVVTAPGYPFWSACIDSTSEALIQLPPAGGALEIQILLGKNPKISLSGATLLVNEARGMGRLSEVFGWMRQNGALPVTTPDREVLRVPNISPGRWAVLWSEATLPDTVMGTCNGTLLQSLDWTTVNPGETSKLLLDRSDSNDN